MIRRLFTCKNCDGTFETKTNTGRLPQRCETCKPKPIVKTEADISPLLSSNSEVVTRTLKLTTASVQTQERALKALTMRRDRFTWEAIAQACGYSDGAAAYKSARGEMIRRQAVIDETIDEMRRHELAHLEMLTAEALTVLRRPHVLVNAGQVVRHNDQDLIDDGPVLAAIETLRKVGESRRKLLGLDAASKSEVTAQVEFVVRGIAEGEMP